MRQGLSRVDRERSAIMRTQGMTWAEIARVIRHDRKVSARAAMRMAHGWTQDQAAAEWNRRWPEDRKEPKYFSYWESWPEAAKGRRPTLAWLTRLAELYDCGVDDLLVDVDYATLQAMAPVRITRPTATMDDVDRRGFLSKGAAFGVAALVAPPAATLLADAVTPGPVLAHVGRTEIDQVLAAAELFNSSGFAKGGGYAIAAANAQLATATQLLSARCPERLRPELLSAVGYLADTCGFMAFDAGDHQSAERKFAAAVACTEEAGDWHLQAGVLMNMTVHALWQQRPADALALTERALAHSHVLTATEQAMVWSTRAGAHGQRGDTRATLEAVGAADDHFTRVDPAKDPAWMDYYTEAEHAGNTGHALYYLAASAGGSTAEALQRHETAINRHGDEYARSRAFAEARRAILLMRNGDPDEAAQAGLAAVDSAGPLLSTRTREYLDVLKKAAAPHATRPAVAELDHRIAQSA